MNQSLKDLESRLEQLSPRGLSDEGREDCHAVIESLVADEAPGQRFDWSKRHPRLVTAAAAMLALGLGSGAGWYLGVKPVAADGGELVAEVAGPEADFDQLDRKAWLITEDGPDLYVTESGEVREIFREVEVTKEVVKHLESGIVVVVETKEHHLVNSESSEF